MDINKTVIKSAIKGLLASLILLGFYFSVVTAISGRVFALSQFSEFWYFLLALALGFGIQVGMYFYLRGVISERASSGKVLAVSGTTSSVAMISCCAHYLVNILPIIGVAGIISLVGQYQIELFWFGLAANAAGIVYIASRIIKFSRTSS